MRDSFFKMFGSVKLVQEVSRSSPSSQPQSSTHLTNQSSTAAAAPPPPPPPPPQVSHQHHHPLSIDTNVHPTTTTTATTTTVERNSEPPITQSPTTPSSSHSSYWPPHSVQPIPLTFNSYTPATPSLPMWISSYSSKQPAARGIRELLFGSSATTTTTTTITQPSCASAPMTSTTTSSMTAPRHTHTRRGSRSIRRSRQLSIKGHGRRPSRTWSSSAVMRPLDSKDKSKSQKLLCLWPLPVITRYTIALSLLVSAFRFANILSATCSAPSFVIYRHEWLNLALSPFLFDWSLHGLLVFGWNVLILGLFEESLTHMLGGTRRFVRVLVSIVISVCLLRQALGYLFSKSTGWAVPLLFFSDSVHECNQGIAPFLFALLMVQSLSIDDKYIVLYGDADPNHKLTVRKVTLQLLMCLVNYLVKNILWWSLTGLLTGYVAAIIIQATILREKRGIATTTTAPTTPTHTTWDDKDVPPAFEEFPRATPLWRLLLSAFRKAFTVIAVTLPLLLLFNAYYYSQEGLVDSTMLNQLSHDRYMFTFVVMTAPRRGEPPLLSRTIESYLANWPVDPAPGSLHSRLQLMVYTHFSNHSQFDAARERFSNDLKGQRYIKWVREEGNEMNQRLHVSKALQLATESFQSTYVALVEDDFPICGSDAWHQLEHVVYQANKHAANHCGVFVGTGGSGLFLKPETAQLVSRLLLQYGDTPPDIVIQKCLRGELAECSHCQDSLVTSKTLLMYHIGFNTSTSTDRVYKKDEFQCGWRHPFNGDPSVITL